MALRWKGFYIQEGEMHPMQFSSLQIELRPKGSMAGEGTDEVGVFSIEGCFHDKISMCRFTKQYRGQHPIYYEGLYSQENKAITGFYGFEPGDNDGAFQLSHE